MPENIRALVVILVLSTAVFTIARIPARAMASVPGEFERRRNLWFAVTLAAFLSFNFWLLMVVVGILLYKAAAKENNVAAMVLFVLLAVPLLSMEIPGFAGIRYLFKLDYLILMWLVVLLPVFIRETRQYSLQYFRNEKPDLFLYSYLILNLTLGFIGSGGADVTGSLRNLFIYFIGTAIPYAVISRQIKDDSALRTAIASYVLGASVMAAIGIVEAARSWLLYTSIERAIGVDWGMSIYLRRGNALRAFASTGQAIAFGYAMAVGLMLMLGLKRYFSRKLVWWAGTALLFLGMLSSYSRGPWLGAAAGFIVFVLTGPRKWVNVGKLLMVGIVGGAILLASPLGDKLYESAVSVDEGSYDYRVRVLEVSMNVIKQNPIFGSRDEGVIDQLEELRQGQGIIDIVNSYVAVALRSGLVGLVLFLGFFASAIFMVLKRMRSIRDKNSEAIDLGRCLLATLACILVSIYTVSGISIVPTVYYLMTALAVAYARSKGVQSSEAGVQRRQGLSLRRPTMVRPKRHRPPLPLGKPIENPSAPE